MNDAERLEDFYRRIAELERKLLLPAYERTARLVRGAELERVREACARLCDEWARAYPEDVFPPPPPPPEPVSRDAVAGSMGRHVTRGLAKQIRELDLGEAVADEQP